VSIGQRLDIPFTLNRFANIFNYATGQAPTLADFATQIGFTLINGAKFGDTIVFDNVGYTLAISVFADYNLMGFLKCSALILLDAAFQDNQLEQVYLPIATTLTNGVFQSNTTLTHVYIPECLFITISSEFSGCNIQYFNAPVIQQIGETTSFDNVFTGNTGNNITVIAPLIHETSNAGGLEGDLDYLDDNNTVTFDWDGDEVPTWISDPIFNPILLLDWQAIVIENESNNLHLKRTARDRKLSLSFRMATQDNINA
jgi:hypothetical protein